MPRPQVFSVPTRRRTTIDPAALAQAYAAPAVAKEQARAGIAQAVFSLPRQFQEQAQLREAQDVLNQERKQKEIDFLPTEKVSLSLVSAFPELRGVPFGQAKALLPSLASIQKTRGISPIAEELQKVTLEQKKQNLERSKKGRQVSAEAARAVTSAESGVASAQGALDILARDPNAARKILIPLGVGLTLKFLDTNLQKFDREITNLADAILRARTGAAATKQEIDNFKNILLGDIVRSPKITIESIQDFMKELKGITRRIEPNKGGGIDSMSTGDLLKLLNQ